MVIPRIDKLILYQKSNLIIFASNKITEKSITLACLANIDTNLMLEYQCRISTASKRSRETDTEAPPNKHQRGETDFVYCDVFIFEYLNFN